MKHLEENEQMILFKWAKMNEWKYPDLKYMFHIPNGGKRNTLEAVRFKNLGVKAGVADIFLPCARSGYNGLWIEMKSPTGRLTEHQKDFLSAVEERNYRTAVCFSAESAIQSILDYLQEVKQDERNCD